jgi:DNA replication and repair protein RecF
VYVSHLLLHDFRSYRDVDVELGPGASAFLGRNGQGKTNLVEAIDYLSRLASHRCRSDAPLIRAGAEQSVIRVAVVREGRTAVLEVELNAGRPNRARVNRADLSRPRDIVGLLRTVIFSPDDLAVVKGDPSERRRFIDDLLVLRAPRLAGVRSDYERVVKQRTSLLKSSRAARRSGGVDTGGMTLEVWDERLANIGAELMMERLRLVELLSPYLHAAYEAVAHGAGRSHARLGYQSGIDPMSESSHEELERRLMSSLGERRREELERGVCLVGPHRDDLLFSLADATRSLPVKAYASHGETWSFALALRLASYDLLRADGDDPILILDDVFAELDQDRREQLATLVSGAEQVLVTAAVSADVPDKLAGARYLVADGMVNRDS